MANSVSININIAHDFFCLAGKLLGLEEYKRFYRFLFPEINEISLPWVYSL